jgi:signal transduction histidine kinase
MLADVGTLDELRVRLARTRAVIDAISRDLDPLAERGLRSALAELTGESGRQVRIRMVGPEPPGHIARAVWYTCAESVANASKHAGSSRINIDVCSTRREVVATITDTGRGGADPLGRGLSGLADRAATVGGSLNVMSGSAGTKVRLTVPWAGDE